VVSLYCDSDDRAPIPPTDAFELKGWQVVAAAMDMETGAIEKLWCPAGNCTTVSGIQRTYAHEVIPHTVATSFSLSNTGASATTKVQPAWMAEMEAMADEEGVTCAVCQEGRTLQPSEQLGLYAYVKKVSFGEGGWSRTYGWHLHLFATQKEGCISSRITYQISESLNLQRHMTILANFKLFEVELRLDIGEGRASPSPVQDCSIAFPFV
jgi:hypothetical protein